MLSTLRKIDSLDSDVGYRRLLSWHVYRDLQREDGNEGTNDCKLYHSTSAEMSVRVTQAIQLMMSPTRCVQQVLKEVLL